MVHASAKQVGLVVIVVQKLALMTVMEMEFAKMEFVCATQDLVVLNVMFEFVPMIVLEMEFALLK
jgi:hypothetical protein